MQSIGFSFINAEIFGIFCNWAGSLRAFNRSKGTTPKGGFFDSHDRRDHLLKR